MRVAYPQISSRIRRIFEDKDGSSGSARTATACAVDGKSFIYFTEKDGFAGTAVRGILQDESGDLWFAISGLVEMGMASESYHGKTFLHGQRGTGTYEDVQVKWADFSAFWFSSDFQQFPERG